MPEEAPDERRRAPRKLKTMFCELVCDGKRYASAILDMSPTGIFVRTVATPAVGAEVVVNVRLLGGRSWSLRAVVARDPQRTGKAHPVPARGLGLQLLEIPDDYSEFVGSL
jgi:hypothetical protein